MLILLILCSLVVHSHTATELLQNADFEQDISGHWHCNGCTVTKSSTHYHGNYSAMVTHRKANWAGLQQTLSVTGGKTYVYRGYIKVLNTLSGHMYHTMDLMARMSVNGHNKFTLMSRMLYLRKDLGWVEIGGDITIPDGTSSIVIYPQISEPDINYLLDDMSFQELPVDNNFKNEAKSRIEKIRKSDIHISLQNPHSLDTSNMEIEINQKKHLFGFGTAVSAQAITDPHQIKYQNFIYNNFEYAVIKNKLKWRLIEWTRGHANYQTATSAISALRAKGIKVRGHCMFWDVNGHSPAWLDGLSKTDMLSEMHKRVNDTINHTRGTLVHWDVNNENLHGDYFEKHLGDPDITAKMFHWMHAAEPNVKLFLNDYNVITSRQYTVPYKAQAVGLKAAGVPISGIGIQGHFHSSDFDINIVKHRLDKIAEAGIPIWITEMSVSDHDDHKKAEAIENLLTLYFSHPSVHGVLFWGFWDGDIGHNVNALATGANVTPNAAGLRYQQLRQSWTSNFRQSLAHARDGLSFRGFHGEYELKVKKNGHVIETKTFSLGPNGNNVTINLQGSNSHPSSTSIFG